MEIRSVAVKQGAVEPGPVAAIAPGVDREPLAQGWIAGRRPVVGSARPGASNEPLKIRFLPSARQAAATPRRTTAERIERIMRASRVGFRLTGRDGSATPYAPEHSRAPRPGRP